jgi:hypothetical protein
MSATVLGKTCTQESKSETDELCEGENFKMFQIRHLIICMACLITHAQRLTHRRRAQPATMWATTTAAAALCAALFCGASADSGVSSACGCTPPLSPARV